MSLRTGLAGLALATVLVALAAWLTVMAAPAA